MIKKLLSCTLILLACTFAAQAQTTVTIGSGEVSGTASPVATFYNSSATESIYTAAEIGTTGYITTLAYQKARGDSTTPLAVKIYIKTTATAFIPYANYTIGNAFADYVLVYDGTLPNNGTGWMQVNLTTPFAYTDATKNISILTVGATCIASGRPQFSYTTASGNRMSAYYNDGAIGCDGTTTFTPADTMRPVWERPNVKLTLTTNLGLTNSTLNNNITVYNSNGHLTVQSANGALKNVCVYDVQGREILNQNTTANQAVLNGLTAVNQLLIVKVTHANNHVTLLKTVY